MKLYHFICVLLLLTSLSSRVSAQAMFAVDNFNPGAGVNAPVYNPDGIPLQGAGYLAELWGGAASNSLAPTISLEQGFPRGIVPFRSDFPGYFTGAAGIVADIPAYGYAWLQVRAWDAGLGGTYEEVEALGMGGYGESSLFYAQGYDPLRDPPDLPAPLIGLQSFSLRPIVPEPTVFALASLGAAALLVLRRVR